MLGRGGRNPLEHGPHPDPLTADPHGPLLAAIERALPPTPGRTPYIELLGRRFRALEALAGGASLTAAALHAAPRDRALARRVLRDLEGEWTDGDENLVRGMLDQWHGGSAADEARRLLAAAGQLQRMQAHARSWWFFLWALESSLSGLVAAGGRC